MTAGRGSASPQPAAPAMRRRRKHSIVSREYAGDAVFTDVETIANVWSAARNAGEHLTLRPANVCAFADARWPR